MSGSGRLHVAVGVLAGVTGGPASYGVRLVRALCGLEGEELDVTVVTDRPGAFEGVGGARIVELPMRGGFDRLRWQHWLLPRTLRKLVPDVYHDTKNALPRGLRVPSVVTVHDLAYYVLPESFGWMSRTFLKRATADAVRRAKVVVVPSEATARDVARFYPQAVSKVAVALHGIDPAEEVSADRVAAVRRVWSLPEHFVLHVGTVQARKNVDLLVRGVRLLRQQGFPHRVVVVGRRGWLADRAMAEIDSDDTALWLGAIPGADLAPIYAAADAFCSPSGYEGFGFTVADALAAGVPTVISGVSSLPEVCGDAAVQLQELSADAVAEALGDLFRDDVRRRELGEQGRARAASFTWERSARSHLDAYRRAAAVGVE